MEVAKFLASLGSSSEAVATALGQRRAYGYPRHGTLCPLAVAIKQACGINVFVTPERIRYEPEDPTRKEPYHTQATAEFARQFDGGEFKFLQRLT